MPSSKLTIQTPVEGYVFEYAPRLTAFEFKNPSGIQSKQVVLFIGGLTDGLLTVPYLPELSKALDKSGWTLVQIIFSSSYSGWGTGSLQRDAHEIGQLVAHLRSVRGGSRDKVVLFGHSTGCQDSVQYLTKFESTSANAIDGAIIQAPVSDREAIVHVLEAAGKPKEYLESLNSYARDLVKQGKSSEVLPKEYSDIFLGAPLSAYRWLSFADVGGDDDFFSSDLSDSEIDAIFGKISNKLLVLYSGSDESVPAFVDKKKLIQRWQDATDPRYWSPYSKIVPGALHNIGPGSDPASLPEAIDAAVKFLKDL